MYQFKSIDEILNHQLKAKKDRSEIKFEDISGFEKPRDIYLKACLTIANYFKEYGFKFSPSSAVMTKQDEGKNLRLKIRFQSDYNNIAGVYVGLSVGFGIEDIDFKKWQKKYGLAEQNPWERIFGGNISAFSSNPKLLLLWNIVDSNEREIAIIEIIYIIENTILPILELFKNVELINNLIIDGNFILLNPLINIQYLLFNKSENEVKNAIANYLNKDKERRNKYIIDNEQIKKERLPSQISGLYYNIAYITNYYGLNDFNLPNP